MQGPTPELKHTLVRAGAGAGKTTGLVARVEAIYEEFKRTAGRPPRIILTTFTRKATQELKERLIELACDSKRGDLLHFVSDPAQLQITTIHGLLSVFLKQAGHLADLDTGFQIVSEGEGMHLARLALRETLIENPESLRWLETYGFDRLLTMCRTFAAQQREHGELRPATLADLKAAARSAGTEWKERFAHLIRIIEDCAEEKPWRTYASGLRDLTASWSDGIPHKEDFPRKPPRKKERTDLEFLDEAVAEIVEPFKAALDKPGWNSEHWAAATGEWTRFHRLAQDFTQRFLTVKETQARFEMNDLELKTLEILRAKPFLAAVFSDSWDYWMIDEYQDTSPLQVEILRALIGDRKRYLVGDPQQSIYLFRGADEGVFRAAEGEIVATGGVKEILDTNYRSRPDLLGFINDFMQSVSGDFERMTPRQKDSDQPRGGPCALMLHAPDKESEYKGIAARVQELIASGARLEQICVLGRTHRGLMEASRVLKGYGYPTHVHAARGFGGRREVLDAQALWKFLINPHDSMNLILLLRSPWFKVEDWRIAEWMEKRPTSLWRRLEILDAVPEAVLRLRACLRGVAEEGAARAFEQALRANAFLDLSLIDDPAGRKESNLWKLIHRAQSLEREGGESLLAMLRGESDDPMESNEGDAASAQEPNSINFMTIHGAKGLQFDHVIVPGMGETPAKSVTEPLTVENGKFFFPIWNDEESEFVASLLDHGSVGRLRAREMAESNRLLYVAVTRAKETLTMTWSDTGRDSWADRSSWFLRKAGEHAGTDYTYLLAENMSDPLPFKGGAAAAPTVRSPRVTGEVDQPARRSVTEMISRDSAVKPSGDDLIKRWQAQNLGTRIHRALEALKYGAVLPGDEEAVRFVMESKDPPLRDWIMAGKTEWGFHVQTAGRVVEGQIDLWAKLDGKLYIVDYKSGSPAFQEQAFQQLSLYAWALRKFGHQEPAEMLVVYPRLKKTVRKEFSEDLFLHWENVLGVAET